MIMPYYQSYELEGYENLAWMDVLPEKIRKQTNDEYGYEVENGEYVTASRDLAEKIIRGYQNRGIYALYGKMEKPYVYDCQYADWNMIKAPEDLGMQGETSVNKIAEQAFKKGYDSVVLENVIDIGEGMNAADYIDSREPSTTYVFKNANQVKSADPVTYDDKGNVIPLSERFNPGNKDIRYSRVLDDITEDIPANIINTLNDITDRQKYNYLIDAFKKNGWNGRPVVLIKNGNEGYTALTGSHRILAARAAGIPVKAVVLDYADDIAEMIDAYDDAERARIAWSLSEEGAIPRAAAELIAREEVLNYENYNVPYNQQKKYSRVIDQDAQEYVERLEQENDAQREEISLLRTMYEELKRVTRERNGKLPKRSRLETIVKKYIFNDPTDTYHRQEVVDKIYKLLNDVYDGKTSFHSFAWDMRGIVQSDVENAGHWYEDGDSIYKQFRQEFRTQDGNKTRMVTIYIADDIYKTIAEKYGGRAQFRNAMFGKMNVTSDSTRGAMGLDAFYDSLVQGNYGLEETTALCGRRA